MKEKSLILKEKISIFEKIRIAFKKLFMKEKFEEAYVSYEKENNTYDMRDELKKQRMTIELQQKYENGKILESEMSEEEKDRLIDLYKKQIEDLENKIIERKIALDNYKIKILEIRKRIKNTN